MIFATTLENKSLFKGHFVHLASLLLYYNNTRIYIAPFPKISNSHTVLFQTVFLVLDKIKLAHKKQRGMIFEIYRI